MTRIVLGIDGGGTKTEAAILDETGRLLGIGFGGPSNYDDVGVATTRLHIDQAVDAARRAAGITLPFAAAFLGMAGVVSPHDREIIHALGFDLELAPHDLIGVDHDCRIALAGGLSGRPGIVLIAGTGSSCYGMNAAGQQWRAGGWGPLISDEGGSYWFGVQALQAAVRAADGRSARTILLDRVIEHFQLSQIDEIMHRLYVIGVSRSELAGLAPMVIEIARQGDPIAIGLLRRGTEDMSECVLAVAQQLGFANGPSELALVGGLLRAGEIITEPLRAAVHARLPHCQITYAEQRPVLGACLSALQMLNIPMEGLVIDELVVDAAQAAQ